MEAPHEGYSSDEWPTYGLCRCGTRIRTDRLDLTREHLVTCERERSALEPLSRRWQDAPAPEVVERAREADERMAGAS